MSEEKKQYTNIMLTGIWPTRTGHFNSKEVDPVMFDKFQRAFELGGKFFIRRRTPESIAKARDPETTPPYFLEFVPAADVKAFSKKGAGNSYGNGGGEQQGGL